MGLAIFVGIFSGIKDEPKEMMHYRDLFSDINMILRQARLPEHHEDEDKVGDIGSLVVPWSCGVGLYSSIHYLRRFYAHVLHQRAAKDFSGVVVPPVPVVEGQRASRDPLLHDAYERFDKEAPCYGSHLIQHADNEGYYIPVDFPFALTIDMFVQPPYPVWVPRALERIEEQPLGSSYGLQRECQDVANILELDLSRADLRTNAYSTFDNIERDLRKLPQGEQPLWLRENKYITEAFVCWVLYHGSLASIASGLTLCFG